MKDWCKLLLFVAACLGYTGTANANQRAYGFCTAGAQPIMVVGLNGTPQASSAYPGCTVTVFLAGTTNLATIFKDNLGTALGNPFTGDAITGYWEFYAANGRYDVLLTNAGIPNPGFTFGDLLLNDSAATNAATLPNTTLAFSATPSFAATTNASYTMTLTGNVTSSTVTGSPANGNLLSFTLVEDSTGTRQFSFPANFVIPPGFIFNTTALAVNASTWKFDGTNWNLISNAGGGTGSIGVPGQNLFYATSYGVIPDVVYAFTGTCSNGSSTISTGAGENPFIPSVVGKVIAGQDSAGSGSGANCPPQGTILTFVDAHHLTVSNVPINPVGGLSFLAWGTNSGSQLSTAYNASYGNGCLILPSGNMFFDVPPFIASSIVTSNVNYPPCVIGQYNTNLTPLPSFNVSNCNVGQHACFFVYGNVTNTLPNFAYLKDFEFLGGNTGSWVLTGNFSTFSAMVFNRVILFNVWVWNVGGSGANSFQYGANLAGTSYLHGFNVFNTGQTAGCLAQGGGGGGAGNTTVTMEQSYCKGVGGSALSVTGFMNSYGNQWDTSGCSSCNTVDVSGTFNSYGDVVLGASDGNAGLAVRGGASAFISGGQINGITTGTGGAVSCIQSGGQIVLETTLLNPQATGGDPTIKTVSGCNVVNHGLGNKFANGGLNLAAGTYSSPGHSVVGACTGTATSSSTLGLYGTGPNLTTSTCTSTTIGAGIVFPGGATLQNLVVFSSAAGTATAAVTVLRNGVATAITCSLNGVTSCTDTTHSLVPAAGDLISYQLVTGAAETVANVKAQVEWN